MNALFVDAQDWAMLASPSATRSHALELQKQYVINTPATNYDRFLKSMTTLGSLYSVAY